MRPVLFHIGGFAVYSYGVMLFLAFLAAIFVARAELNRRGLDGSAIYLTASVAAITGVVGARIFYVLGNLEHFSGNWGQVFDLNMRGLVFYGGLALAVPSCILLLRRMKLPPGAVADAVGLGMPLALAIARVGCFLNGCCGGKPSGLPWAVTFPGRPWPFIPSSSTRWCWTSRPSLSSSGRGRGCAVTGTFSSSPSPRTVSSVSSWSSYASIPIPMRPYSSRC